MATMAGAARSIRPQHWADEIQGCDTATACQEATGLKSRVQFSLRGSSAGRGAGLQRAELGDNFSCLSPSLPLFLACGKEQGQDEMLAPCRAGCRRTQGGLCLPHHVLGEGCVLHGAADEPRRGRPQLQAALHHLHDSAVSSPLPAPEPPVMWEWLSELPVMCPHLKAAVWSCGGVFGAL